LINERGMEKKFWKKQTLPSSAAQNTVSTELRGGRAHIVRIPEDRKPIRKNRKEKEGVVMSGEFSYERGRGNNNAGEAGYALISSFASCRLGTSFTNCSSDVGWKDIEVRLIKRQKEKEGI